MKIDYDKTEDAKYIKLSHAKVKTTTEERDWLLFDRDENGEVVGIEILDASKHQIGIATLCGKFLEWSESITRQNKINGMGLSESKLENSYKDLAKVRI